MTPIVLSVAIAGLLEALVYSGDLERDALRPEQRLRVVCRYIEHSVDAVLSGPLSRALGWRGELRAAERNIGVIHHFTPGNTRLWQSLGA